MKPINEIVARLREADARFPYYTPTLCNEAADLIEQLSAHAEAMYYADDEEQLAMACMAYRAWRDE